MMKYLMYRLHWERELDIEQKARGGSPVHYSKLIQALFVITQHYVAVSNHLFSWLTVAEVTGSRNTCKNWSNTQCERRRLENYCLKEHWGWSCAIGGGSPQNVVRPEWVFWPLGGSATTYKHNIDTITQKLTWIPKTWKHLLSFEVVFLSTWQI